MPRAKRGFKLKRRHKKVLKLAKGYYGGRSRLFRTATEAVDRGLKYAYRDRRAKKRSFRRLWIARINAAARLHDISYSRLMNGLNVAGVDLDRKVLAQMAVSDPDAFGKVVETAKQHIAGA